MKTLLIMRHGKSSWSEGGLPDHERPLNKRGEHDAPLMGKLLREKDLAPDLILSSTAVRARKTAKAVAEKTGYEDDIRYHSEIYEEDYLAILEILRTLPDEVNTLLVVGHNPTLEELASELLNESITLTTATIVKIDLPLEHWSAINEVTPGKFGGLWAPKEL